MSFLFSRTPALAECAAPEGLATVLTLDSVDRVDAAGGSAGGPPGRAATHYLQATPTSEIAFEELFAPDSSFVLYSIEKVAEDAPFLVFLSLSSEARRKMWLEEAFIDRGIRKLVEVGSQVAVASLKTAESYAENALARFASGEWQVSFVWNTGRCGSTLMHKAVSAMGTASFSEPHWLDQLQFNGLGEAHLQRAVRVCVGLEALTARLQTAVPGWERPTNFVFNPKAGGMPLAEATVTAFPLARHAFMYRCAHKVVDSFTGLTFPDGVPKWMSIAWRFIGLRALALGLTPPLKHEMAELMPLSELSSIPVVVLTCKWVGTIRGWIGTTARRAKVLGADDPLASAIVLRMDEFTSKDLELRAQIVRTALTHFRVVGAGASDADIALALDVFSVHSQAGSKMSGPKAKIVTDGDVEVIKRCVVNALGSAGVVQDGGANIALPRSLGIASM